MLQRFISFDNALINVMILWTWALDVMWFPGIISSALLIMQYCSRCLSNLEWSMHLDCVMEIYLLSLQLQLAKWYASLLCVVVYQLRDRLNISASLHILHVISLYLVVFSSLVSFFIIIVILLLLRFIWKIFMLYVVYHGPSTPTIRNRIWVSCYCCFLVILEIWLFLFA